MREYDSNWLSKCNDEELLPPEELMPLSQSLITPDLALAFDISNPNTAADGGQSPSVIRSPLGPSHPNSGEFDVDSGDLGSGGGGGDDTARTLKRPRLVWTPQLHKRFVEAVAQLGIKNAVPKTIMQLMNVDGLTRENVASHLQKYRLYLKRMQGLNGGNGIAAGFGGGSDPATDRLFASSPVPAQFLHPGRHNWEQFSPYAPLAALQRQQMVTAVGHHQLQNQFNKQVNFGMNGQFEHSYMVTRYGQQPVHRMGQTTLHNSVPGYVEDMESASGNEGRKVLTLFPMGDD